MRMLTAIIVLTYVGGVPVLAQQPATGGQAPPAKVYTFKDLTPQDVGLIGKGLTKLTYEESAALLQKLQNQITAQDNPPPVEPPVKGKR